MLENADKLAEKIWNYMKMNHKLEKADIIIGFGNYDMRTAERVTELYFEEYAPLVLFSGDGSDSKRNRNEREAEMFAKLAIEKGVPEKDILIEPNSKNTGENILFSKKLLEERGIKVKKIIAVHKPYTERRVYASVKKQWPEVEVIVTSAEVSYNNYKVPYLTKEELIGSIASDCQRMWIYPPMGFQIEQYVPLEIKEAVKKLHDLGFNRRSLK